VERAEESAEDLPSLSCLLSLLIHLNAANYTTAVDTLPIQGTPKQMKKNTGRRNNPKAGKCSKCGETVGVGWGHAQHDRICRKVRSANIMNYPATTNVFHTPAPDNEVPDASGDTDNACGGDDTLTTQNGNEWWDNDLETSVLHNGTSSLSSYLSSLTDVDPEHICECIDWGCNNKTVISDDTREIAKFLKVAMLGKGLSVDHMQAFLDYTHAMGGKKAALLPKTVDGCWNAITRVSMSITSYFASIFLFCYM